MILLREPDEVTTWLLAFYPQSHSWWARYIPGRYKHVAAFAWSPVALTWVFKDVSLFGEKTILLPGGDAALATIGHWIEGASVLRIAAQPHLRMRLRIGMWCVPAVKHLLGLKGGALLPDGLWRDCLKAGAEILFDGAAEPAEATASQSGCGRRAEPSESAEYCADAIEPQH